MPCFTQAMINLLLTGRAVPNVFNGDIEYHKNGRKMVGYFLIYFVIGQLEVAFETWSVLCRIAPWDCSVVRQFGSSFLCNQRSDSITRTVLYGSAV